MPLVMVLIHNLALSTKNYSIVERDYPNVTTLRSGLCYRKSVCLSSVCNVGELSSGVGLFGNIS